MAGQMSGEKVSDDERNLKAFPVRCMSQDISDFYSQNA
jgi:hypothetical protein